MLAAAIIFFTSKLLGLMEAKTVRIRENLNGDAK
tara:strand:- start:926 stop:1027 length:102 start_codon:yes stop_codon:yes gene_type:complete